MNPLYSSRPLPEKSDVGHEREEELPYIHAQFDDHQQGSPDVTLNTNMKSGSVRLRTKQPVRPHSQIASGSKRISREIELTRAFSPFVNDSVAPSGRVETESHENSAVGFFRSLALRFSKRCVSYLSLHDQLRYSWAHRVQAKHLWHNHRPSNNYFGCLLSLKISEVI